MDTIEILNRLLRGFLAGTVMRKRLYRKFNCDLQIFGSFSKKVSFTPGRLKAKCYSFYIFKWIFMDV